MGGHPGDQGALLLLLLLLLRLCTASGADLHMLAGRLLARLCEGQGQEGGVPCLLKLQRLVGLGVRL